MSVMPQQGQMPPQYDTRPPAPSPIEALGRRIALLEDRVKALEKQLAQHATPDTAEKTEPEQKSAPASAPARRTRKSS